MIRNLMAAAAVGGLMLSTALAQAPSGTQMGGGGSASMPSQSITQQGADQWLASKFMGTDVIGTDDAKIGDVSDVLFDKQGKVDALIVGVGGFLGIGQKDVALPISAFQVIAANSGRNNTSSDQLRLSMTKDQLTQMAEFKSSSSSSTTTGAGSAGRPAAPAGGTTAPSSR